MAARGLKTHVHPQTVTLADVPERKNDLVEGKYLIAVKKGATVAVKVIDMLGEEVLVLAK